VTDLQTDVEPVFQFDSLLDPAFSKCPQPYYKRMRDTNPVLRAGDDTAAAVFIAKHEDIDHVLHTPEMFSSKFHESGARPDQPLIPINIDPPDHRKWRRLLDPFFNPKQMAKLEDDITARVNKLIDGFIERGECDYAEEYAVPLPCTVFLKLMGLPLEELEHFISLKERLLRGGGGGFMQQDDIQKAAYEELTAIFEQLIVDRRREPQDDLLTSLVNAEIDDRPLTHDELLGTCHLLFIAGLDTVTDSLTCFYAFLAQNPEHRRRIVENPDLIPRAIEEMLRFESPVPFVPRVAQEETTLSGCPVHKGESVIVLLGSANNDERLVDRPEVVDFDRPSAPHYAFGGGVHRCLGSHLARIELRVSLREWHRRIPEYHIPEGTELQFAALLRQVEHLPLVFDQVVS
jgi:cytochrome P450